MHVSPDQLDSICLTLNHTFADVSLLERALTHTSAADTPNDSFERLEFLGDRVLGLIVARLLFESFPHEEEGALARRFAALTRREALARVAQDIDLGACLNLSIAEDEAGGRDNPAILADACEAVLGALYLDGGLDRVDVFVRRYWVAMMDEDLAPPKDAKTALQEWAQARGLGLPHYTDIESSGPSHAPTFIISVSVSGEKPQQAKGSSKRAASLAAAEKLLAVLESGTS